MKKKKIWVGVAVVIGFLLVTGAHYSSENAITEERGMDINGNLAEESTTDYDSTGKSIAHFASDASPRLSREFNGTFTLSCSPGYHAELTFDETIGSATQVDCVPGSS